MNLHSSTSVLEIFRMERYGSFYPTGAKIRQITGKMSSRETDSRLLVTSNLWCVSYTDCPFTVYVHKYYFVGTLNITLERPGNSWNQSDWAVAADNVTSKSKNIQRMRCCRPRHPLYRMYYGAASWSELDIAVKICCRASQVRLPWLTAWKKLQNPSLDPSLLSTSSHPYSTSTVHVLQSLIMWSRITALTKNL
jgi:hypothetical protein